MAARPEGEINRSDAPCGERVQRDLEQYATQDQADDGRAIAAGGLGVHDVVLDRFMEFKMRRRPEWSHRSDTVVGRYTL
jgi:hypothetical protein